MVAAFEEHLLDRPAHRFTEKVGCRRRNYVVLAARQDEHGTRDAPEVSGYFVDT